MTDEIDVLIRRIAREIVDGTLPAHEGARVLWWEAWMSIRDEPRSDPLAVFIGLATDWEDHLEARPEIEGEIRTRAATLLEDWSDT